MRARSRVTAVRHWVGWQAVTVGSVGALVVFIGITSSRFFFAGDKQNQYLPVARDIGRRLLAGEWLPVIDPDLGRSGNYALDLQYGLFEPTHWVVAVALSTVDNLTVAALLWAAAYLGLLAAGVCALLLRLGAQGGWAAATGVAVATSGYVLFWAAPSWIPALVSLAWVPWWWWTVTAPRARPLGLVASGLLTFLICGGGWPATWLIWGAVVIGVLTEAWVRRTEPGAVKAVLLHLLASAGGGLVALLTVLPVQRAVDYTARSTEMENNGAFVPNLADILAFAHPGLQGDLDAFGAYPVRAPLFFGVWFAVVLLWLVPWRRLVLQRPGVVTALTGLLLTLLLTQAPTSLGPLRWPVRMLPGVPLFLGVGVTLAVTVLGLRVSRGRVAGVMLTVGAMGLLTWMRRPDSDAWLLPSVLLLVAAALLLWAAARGPARMLGPVALVSTLLLTGWTVDEHSYAGMSDRGTPPSLGPGAMALDEEPTLVLYPNSGPPVDWFPQGVAPGFLRLTETQRTQPGYSSLGQGAWDERFCVQSAHSYTCGNAAEQVNDVEPRTGLRWVDLLGYDHVVVHDERHLVRWRAAMRQADEPGTWDEAQRTRDFVKISRVEPLEVTGRVTAVLGDAAVSAVEVDKARQSYRVESSEGATLVFRDLYWPGYTATLDGREVETGTLDDMLLTVELPAGAEGTLEVGYVPMPTRLWVSLVVAGSLLVLLAAILSLSPRLPARLRRRPRSASRGS